MVNRKTLFLIFFVSVLLLGTQMANAATYGLANFIVNDNGNVTFAGGPFTDGNLNLGGYDQTGEPADNTLGSVVITLSPSLSTQAVAFYTDYDVDFQAAVGGGSFNDLGSVHGVALPGFTYALTDFNAPTCAGDSAFCDVQNVPFTGFANVNQDGVAAGGKSPNSFDVDMGLGITGLLAPKGGTVTFTVSNTVPTGFYLQQMNDQTGDSIYLSATVNLLGGPPPPTTPEPSYLWVVALSLPLYGLWRRRRSAA